MRIGIGVGFVLLSALAYASTPAFVTLSYGTHLNAVSLVALRCLAGAVVLAVLARNWRNARLDGPTATRLLLLGGLLFGPQMLLYFLALQRLDTAITVALVYTYPAIVVMMVGFRERTRPPPLVVGLLLIATVGVVAAAGVKQSAEGSALGVALALATALGYASYVLLSDTAVQRVPPLHAGAVVLLGAGLSSLVLGAAAGRAQLPASAAGWIYLGLHGVVIVPVGLAAYYAGLRRLGPSLTSIIDICQPALAAIIGAIALGEHTSAVQRIGIVLILLTAAALPIAGRLDRRVPAEKASTDARPAEPSSRVARD